MADTTLIDFSPELSADRPGGQSAVDALWRRWAECPADGRDRFAASLIGALVIERRMRLALSAGRAGGDVAR